ncbi:succinyldiaminopimelate transaminase [Gulosibacter faecalis]|uniref:Aminotransferase n=1 Tax=Gulosibacter faecalis TaxID=272240 RepID=A0ABW5V0Q0_9MICO|nr:succinyldiaminopimelate transaminase [Gulosibacter faecalis]
MGLQALPAYPWDRLDPIRTRAAERAAELGVDVVDLTVGSPVDPTPQRIRDALVEATDAHGYPTTAGTAEARDAVAEWFARDRGVPGLTRDDVLLTVGSKEFVASAAFFLGIGAGDAIVQPEVAYPTYEMGAVFAGAELVRADDPDDWPAHTKLVWLNSPGNPTGRVLDADFLRRAVARARELGAIIINDECYAELGWDAWADRRIPSILDPDVVGDDHTGVLACSSLSKRSNLAGYRAAYVAGDAEVLAKLLVGRKHAGLMMPSPVQHALAVALGDTADAREQYERYESRREVLAPAVRDAGLRIDDSEAGLYLWVTRGEDCWSTVAAFAELAILTGPGEFYGDAGSGHVRLTLTAPDAAISEAAWRLRQHAL